MGRDLWRSRIYEHQKVRFVENNGSMEKHILLSLLVVGVAGVSEPAGIVDLDVGADRGHVSAVAGVEDGLLPAHGDGIVL